MLVFGPVVTFFGGKFFPYVLATVSGGLVFMITLLLASVFGALKALDKNRKATSGQIAATVFSFLIAAVLAVFVGWFLKKTRRIGITILGALAGFFVGFLLYTFVFAQWLDHVAVLVVLAFGCAIILGFLAFKFDRHIIVYLTAFIGAYAFIRGISIFAGKFPNEVVLFGQLAQGVFTGLGYEFYLYLAAIVATGIAGTIVQFKLGYHEHNHDEEYSKIN